MLQKHSSTSYFTRIEDTLQKLNDIIDNKSYCNEAVFKDGVLSCKINSIGEYVFNKQPPLQQLWASSPLTGPKKFTLKDDLKWYGITDMKEIIQYAKEEISKIEKILKQKK